MLFAITADGLSQLEDTPADVVIVDRSTRVPMKLYMRHEGPGFVFRLGPDWSAYE